MSTYEDYIFCSPLMHDKFCAIAEILGMIVANAPRPISILQIKNETKRSNIEVRHICMDLAVVGLLTRQFGRQEQWLLNKDSKSVTLEDVYLCMMQTQERLSFIKAVDTQAEKNDEPSRFQSALDTFIMQAVMGINQSVRSHLRHFFLDRATNSAATPHLAARSSALLRQVSVPDAISVEAQ